jgi:hypothetical protein
VEGYLDAGGALFDLQDHWRLDTDMYAPCRRVVADGNGNPSKEPHPLFHFQRGGHAQDAFAAADFLPANPCSILGVWKGLMQSPGPRIPIVPLDPILAIDFCLSQNDGLVWRRLRNFPARSKAPLAAHFLRNCRTRSSGELGLAPQCWPDGHAVKAA